MVLLVDFFSSLHPSLRNFWRDFWKGSSSLNVPLGDLISLLNSSHYCCWYNNAWSPLWRRMWIFWYPAAAEERRGRRWNVWNPFGCLDRWIKRLKEAAARRLLWNVKIWFVAISKEEFRLWPPDGWRRRRRRLWKIWNSGNSNNNEEEDEDGFGAELKGNEFLDEGKRWQRWRRPFFRVMVGSDWQKKFCQSWSDQLVGHVAKGDCRY